MSAERAKRNDQPPIAARAQTACKAFVAARFRLPIWIGFVLIMLIVVIGRADKPTSPTGTMVVRGQSVWRWQEGPVDWYLLAGDCRVATVGANLRADHVLLRVQRIGATIEVETLAVGSVDADGRLLNEWLQTYRLENRPSIDAGHYRGAPSERPAIVERLLFLRNPGSAQGLAPEAPDAATHPIQQAQYELPAPPGTLSTPRPEARSRPEALPTPAPLPQPPDMESRAQAVPVPQPLPNSAAAPYGQPTNQPPYAQPIEGPTDEDNRLRFLVDGGAQAVEVRPRNASIPPQISLRQQATADGSTDETIVIARGGVTILVRDVQAEMGTEVFEFGAVSLSADRIVGWMPSMSGILNGTSTLGEGDGELYLEGDIVFSQGDRIIYAERMYYNVARQYGMVLDAEVLTSIPQYEGLVRLKAEVLQQVARGEFVAFDAAITTSRMGVPRYWLQSEQLRLSTQEVMTVDRETGLGTMERRNLASSRNNFVYVGGVPLLYWPVFTSDLKHSNLYLTDIDIKNDNIFGTQLFLDFDLFQVLGIDQPPDGVEWTLSTDYLSERGPAIGTNIDYTLPGMFGLPGPVRGYGDAWAIDDSGTDFLGVGRQDLPPERDLRGRALLRHRHYLPNDLELIAEVGFLSDRNFLEQYLENEWDRDKDHDTGVRLRKYYYNNLFDLAVSPRINDFFTETNQLPRLDHYGLGGSLLGDRLTWSMHNQVGYADLEVADAPLNPIEQAKFTPLPGETNASGVVAATRQELALPVSAGPLNIVPFVSGEAAYFGEDTTGQDRTRLLGQAGVRATLPMWKQFPTVQSSLLNIRSLAHKMEWRSEFFYADSDANLDDIPLYDPLDDDAQEQFRRRLIFDNFGGLPLPDKFDPRNYAFRQGLQQNVTSPSMPIADDLMQARLGLNQRWQTKRGLAGRERIVDLALLDVDVLLFPEADRDNFGETLGPARYDFRYHAGDRVTFLSDGYFDFFSEGLRSISAGVMSSRPGMGDVYVGFLSLEGPISSSVLRSAIDYRLNEKWILGAGTTFDLGAVGNVGQSFSLTKIGESGLWRIGINVDSGRDNVGFVFGFEPRFWPRRRLGNLGGQLIPPPGVEGLE